MRRHDAYELPIDLPSIPDGELHMGWLVTSEKSERSMEKYRMNSMMLLLVGCAFRSAWYIGRVILEPILDSINSNSDE